jgi:hypothetical protein
MTLYCNECGSNLDEVEVETYGHLVNSCLCEECSDVYLQEIESERCA